MTKKYKQKTPRLGRVLAASSLLAALSKAAFAACATTTQSNTSLGAGACVGVDAGTSGAWVLDATGHYVAAGHNTLTANTRHTLLIDTLSGGSVFISVTLNGPMNVSSTAPALGNASLLYVVAPDPAHTAAVRVKGDFTGTIFGFDPQGITAWGAGASVALHGVTVIVAHGHGTGAGGSGILMATHGGTIVSDNSITIRARDRASPDGVAGVAVGPRAVVNLSGHVGINVSSVGRGGEVSGGALTVTGADHTSRIAGGVGIAATDGATIGAHGPHGPHGPHGARGLAVSGGLPRSEPMPRRRVRSARMAWGRMA